MANPALKLQADGSPLFELTTMNIGGDDLSISMKQNRAGVVHTRYGVPIGSRTWKHAKTWNLKINFGDTEYIEGLRDFFESGAFYLYPDMDNPAVKYSVFWDSKSFNPKQVIPGKYSLIAKFVETTIGAGTPTNIGGNSSQTINGDLTVNGDLSVTGVFNVNSFPTVRSEGNIYLNYNGPDEDSYLYFYNNTNPEGHYLKWDEGVGFELSYNLNVAGELFENGTSLTNKYSQLGHSHTHTHPASEITSGTFPSAAYTFQSDVTVGQSLNVAGPAMKIDSGNAGVGQINFSDGSAYLQYIVGQGYFTMDKPLHVTGEVFEDGVSLSDKYLQAAHTQDASTITTGTFPTGNYTFNDGIITARSSVTDTPIRLHALSHTLCGLALNDTNGVNYIVSRAGASGEFHWTINGTNRMQLEANGNLQIDGTLYATGNITSTNNCLADANVYVNYAGTNENGSIYFHDGSSTAGGYIHFNKNTDEFTFSHKLNLSGGISGIQNSKSMTIPAPEDNDDLTMWFTDVAITVNQTNTVVRGSSPSVPWTVKFASTRDAAGSTMNSGTQTSSSGTEDLTMTDSTIPAGNWIWLELGTVSGTVDEFHITLKYTED